MSDQTEKPKGALPKGYDADTPSVENTSSTETVRHKKINFKKLFSVTPTDQDQREKDLQEYESSYLARIEKKAGPRSEESSDSFLVDLVEDEEPQEDLGKLNLSKHAVIKRKKLQEERAEYEQKYLSKYKEPKGKPRKKGLSKIYKPETKVKVDRKKVRREYERKFLTRIKKEKTKSSKTGASKLYTLEQKVKRDMNKERAEYEKKFLARYKEPKSKSKKSSNLKYTGDMGRLDLRKHSVVKRKEYLAKRAEYEKKFLARYKPEKIKSSRKGLSSLYKPEPPKPKRDMKKERADYEKKFLARYKEPKSKSNKSSISKYDDDLGRLNIRKHSVVKRREYLANRKDYEAKYIQRYMSKQNSKPKRSSGKKLDHDLISGRLNLREFVDKKRKELHVERNVYEQKYLARYKQANAKATKSGSGSASQDDLGRLNFRKHTVAKRKEYLAERAAYEQKYIARYNKQKKPGSKKRSSDSSLYKPEPPKPKRDMKKERVDYEKNYLARYQKQQKTIRKKKK